MTEVKRGMLKYYHRGLLSKKWKEYKFILYDSSLLTWYIDIKHKKADGMILLKDIERFICVGPFTRCLPDFPHLDNEYDQVALIAFPMSITNRDRDIVWLLCDDIEDLNSWMKAIVQTLPSHALQIGNMTNNSPSIITKDIQMDFQSKCSPIDSSERLTFKNETIIFPLAAGLIGSRLQGHTIDSKINPLQKAGYNYGNTLWGTGEGWGFFSPLTIPGFAAIGGSGCYANDIESVCNEDGERRLKEVQERIDGTLDNEEVVEVLSDERDEIRSNDEDQIDDKEDDYSDNHEEDNEIDHEDDDYGNFSEMRETLEMMHDER